MTLAANIDPNLDRRAVTGGGAATSLDARLGVIE
jgi:hypothetical protein